MSTPKESPCPCRGCVAAYDAGYKAGHEAGYRDGYNAHAVSRAHAEAIYGPYSRETCVAETRNGNRCQIDPEPHSEFCHVHDPDGEYRRQHPKFKVRRWNGYGTGSPA